MSNKSIKSVKLGPWENVKRDWLFFRVVTENMGGSKNIKR